MPAEKSLRPQQQDQQHRKKEDEICKLRQQRLAKIVDETDNDAADERAEQAAAAAHVPEVRERRGAGTVYREGDCPRANELLPRSPIMAVSNLLTDRDVEEVVGGIAKV